MAGKKLSDFMLLNSMEQMINEATHYPRDNIETCIDLVLTDKPTAFVHSEVIPSPDPRCKHQIVNGTINFSVPSPPPYKRKLWKYSRAKVDAIVNDFRALDWGQVFANMDADQMVLTFNDIVLKIMNCHIPNNVVTINDKFAPWVTPEVKNAIKKNKKYIINGKSRENLRLIEII